MDMDIYILIGFYVLLTLVGIFRLSTVLNAKRASKARRAVSSPILLAEDIYALSAATSINATMRSSQHVEVVVKLNGEPIASKGYIVTRNAKGRAKIHGVYDHS